MHYDLEPATGSLRAAEGTVPIAGRADAITVSWKKSGGELRYTLQTPAPLTLRLPEKLGGKTVHVARDFSVNWPIADVL